MDGPRPSFFIAGAPKCGTTALYAYLKKHPGVFLPKKELHFFGRDLSYKTPPYPLETYLQYYRGGQGKLCGDASVWYLESPEAPGEIKKFDPDSRILICL